jgi:hypothetical protein
MYWLLLVMAMKTKPNPLNDGSEKFDQFNVEFCLLSKNMGEVMKVILTLMLDPCFKSSSVVDNSRAWNSIHFITKYDLKEVIFLLMKFAD